MMRRVIVHIGMGKTGSSSIQQTLRRGLADPAFRYAGFGGTSHSRSVYSLFSDSPEAFHGHRKRGWGKEEIERFNIATRERIIQDFKACKASTVIISGEGIGNLEEAGLRRFREFLADHFEEIVVVGYVRPPRSYMGSTFQQGIKGCHNRLNLKGLYPKYRKRFKKFDLIFGPENVHLWKFDPKSFPQGDVVLDFCRRLGIDMRPEALRRANESISKEAVSLLFAYRKFGPGYGVGLDAVQANRRLIAALRTIGSGKLRFAPEVVRPVLDANCEDIQWMEERLGESLTESLQGSDDDVRSETDLLRIHPSTVEDLKGLLGEEFLPEGIKGETPQEVAQLVHALRVKLAEEAEEREPKGIRKKAATAERAGGAGHGKCHHPHQA